MFTFQKTNGTISQRNAAKREIIRQYLAAEFGVVRSCKTYYYWSDARERRERRDAIINF
jgi:uncharacterized protein involved in tolerance to divalent cations